MKIIGISGVARSGKDTFADGLAEIIKVNHPNLKISRESFAEPLKRELADFVLEKFNKDIFNLEGEDKELIRPLLVAYGQAKRKQTNGRYWIDLLSKKVALSNPDVVIISDFRFPEEVEWLKQQKGVLTHVKRFTEKIDPEKTTKTYFPPINSDEKENDPKLREAADFKNCWISSTSEDHLKSLIEENCLDFYCKNINLFL